MSVVKRIQGFVVPPESATTLSAAEIARALGVKPPQAPHVPQGKEGVNVFMSPIPGVSAPDAFPNGKSFIFQVPPIDLFGVDGDAAHNDYQTIGDGEHSSPGSGRSLRTLSYQTMFLDWQPSWSMLHAAGWAPDPQQFIHSLERIRDLRKPFHLLAHQARLRSRYDVNMAATLRTVHWEIRGGEDDAYYISVGFKEFRSQSIQEFLVGAAHHKDLPARLTVKNLSADRNTLQKLAIYYYGDPAAARQIAASNGLTNVPLTATLTPKLTQRTTITVPVVQASKIAKERSQH